MSFGFDVIVEDAAESVVVLAVVGELDVATAPTLREAAQARLDAGATRFVVDLSRATFLDSSGLGAIIGLAKRSRSDGGEIALVNTDENIARTLEITGLDQVFSISPTRDAAVSAAAR